MNQYILFALLGLGNGAVFAALGTSLVVTYRSSGVINFATGAMALFSAYFYAFLRQGEIFVPIPGLPTTITLGSSLPIPVAMLLALIFSALLFVVVYAVVFRPLRDASPLAKIVASVGLMLLFQALFAQRLGTNPVQTGAIFPTTVVKLGPIDMPQDRLWFAGTIVVIGVLIWAAYRFTRFGLATRAVSDTEKGSIVSGVNPQSIAVLNWGVSGIVAGLSGILIAPIVPLVPISYTLFIVPALAAALCGRFIRVGPTIIGGLAIGAAQSVLTYIQAQHPWLPSSGLPDLIPLAMILVLLGVRGTALPTRGEVFERSPGRSYAPHRMLVPALGTTAAMVVALVLTQHGWRAGLVTSVIMAIIALSWVVITGFVGQVSLVQLTLAGVGAFSLSTLSTSWGIPFPFAPLLAAAFASLVGVLVGIPALRIRGLSFAIVSLALAVAIEDLWFQNSTLTGGANGATVSGPTLGGLNLSPGVGASYPRLSFSLLCLIVLVATAAIVGAVRLSRFGGKMLAVRDSERSAAAAGINVARTKIIAFGLSAFIAGVGGSMLAYQQSTISPDSFSELAGLGVLAIVFLAGITSLPGGLAAGILAPGGIIFFLISQEVNLGQWYGIVSGIALVAATISFPEGMTGPVLAKIEARQRQRRAMATLTSTKARNGNRPETRALRPAGAETRSASNSPGREQAILALREVSVHYGGVTAVNQVSLSVSKGSITGLIGPNGAGKTSLIDAVSGFTRASGEMNFAGSSLSRLAAAQRARLGLARTFQGAELWEDLTVLENLTVGETCRLQKAHSIPLRGRLGSEPSDDVLDVLRLLDLEALAQLRIGELSQGQRKLVGVARSLAGRPQLLILDEPAAGLDSTESQQLAQKLLTLRDAGLTVLLVDHDMALVLGVCDVLNVLDFGCLIATGTPDDIQRNEQVRSAYLGSVHARDPVVT